MPETPAVSDTAIISVLKAVLKVSPATITLTLTTLVLFAMEVQRLIILGIPFELALSGFSAFSAAIANFGSLVLLGALIVACLVIAVALILFSGVLVAMIGSLSAWGITTGLRFAFLWLGLATAGPVLLHKAWLTMRIWVARDPIAQEKFTESRNALRQIYTKSAREKLEAWAKRLGNWLDRVVTKITGFKGRVIRFFAPKSMASLFAWQLRAVLTILVFGAVFLAQRLLVIDQYRQMVEDSISPAGAFMSLAPEDNIGERWLEPVAQDYEDQLRGPIVSFFSPSIRFGTLTLQGPSDESHLLQSEDGEKAFRTEQVFFLGTFGQWTYLARRENLNDRMMVRTEKILEFAQFQVREAIDDSCSDDAEATAKEGCSASIEEADAGNEHEPQSRNYNVFNTLVLLRLLDLTTNRQEPDDALAAVQRDLQRIEAAQSRTDERVLRFIFGYQPSAPNEPTLAAVSDLLKKAQEGQRHRTELAAKLASLEDQLASHAGNESHESRTELAANVYELSQQVPLLRNGLENSRERLAVLEREVELETGKIVTKVIDGVVEALPDAVKRDTPWTGAPDLVAQSLRDGVSTRPRGLLNDLDRLLGQRPFSECTTQYGSPIGAIDFEEGADKGRDGRQIDRLWATIRQSENGEQDQIVLLRGGASDSGPHSVNLQLSERRAEWAKKALVRAALQAGDAEVLERLSLVPIGDGERVGTRAGPSPRAVLAFACRKTTGSEFATVGPKPDTEEVLQTTVFEEGSK